MQIRRPAVWLLVGIVGLSELPSIIVGEPAGEGQAVAEVGGWAQLLQVLVPLAVGALLADRFPRDRRARVDEVLAATPTPDWARLLGKYLGATAATLVPMVIVYAVGVAWLATRLGDPRAVLGAAVPAFLLVNLPGLLLVAAWSVCCPIVMKVPLYQFLFVGYWFWGNMLSPKVMPTLSDTWLTPIGTVAKSAFFDSSFAGITPVWTTTDAFASIALLLGSTFATLVTGVLALRMQRSRA